MTSQPISDQQKLHWFKKDFRSHFEIWVLSPARSMIADPNAKMPAFVWITCAIDWVAGYWWGKSTQGKVKQCYIGFINQYFPTGKYDADGLYDSLRNGLVHMYTIKGAKYALTDNHPERHLLQTKDGQIVLNLEDFFDDFVNAINAYFNDVETDPTLFRKFIERLERDGFLAITPLNL